MLKLSCSQELIYFKALFFLLITTISCEKYTDLEQHHHDNRIKNISTKSIDNLQDYGKENTLPAMVASLIGNDQIEATTLNSNSNNHHRTEFGWSMILDNSNRYKLNWNYNYSQNSITFALNINQSNSSTFNVGSDIFAIGFSEYGKSLASSDFCMIWYDLSHSIHLQDARTDSQNVLELIDESQSVCKLLQITSEDYRNDKSQLKKLNYNRRQEPYNYNVKHNQNNNVRRLDHNNNNNSNDNDNELEIKFTRPLDVCNSVGPYYSIDNGTTHLVWFTLKGPLLNIDGLNLSQALNNNEEFGMKRVQLIASKPFALIANNLEQKNNNNIKSYTIKMENFHIPAKETTYWCKLFKLSKKFHHKRFHITKYGPVIERNNEHIVHHMELFNCVNLNKNQELELNELYNSGGWSGECGDTKNRPKVTQSCKKVIMAWAMGAHPLEYPDLVGQSIGGHNYSPYVVLEVHYNNVKAAAGFIDSSGLRFYYTNKLRPYEAGILEVGLEYTDKYAIPPNFITPLVGYCVSECTRVGLAIEQNYDNDDDDGGDDGCGLDDKDTTKPSVHLNINNDDELDEEDYVVDNKDREEERERRRKRRKKKQCKLLNGKKNESNNRATKQDYNKLDDGIYIFAAQLHTHLTGISSWTEHIREGRLLGELQRDNHYSPHFQEIRYLPRPVHVAPGDALVHYCLYDTSGRSNVTLGGESTTDEMCVTYIHYYPRIDLEVCKSSVDTKALEDYFAYLAEQESQNTSSKLLIGRSGGNSQSDEKKLLHSNNDNENKKFNKDFINAKSVSENYRSIRWTRKRSEELIQFYSNAPLSVQCNRSNGERFPGHWNGIMPTQIWQDRKQFEPYNLRALIGKELVSYRGHDVAKQRHKELCALQ